MGRCAVGGGSSVRRRPCPLPTTAAMALTYSEQPESWLRARCEPDGEPAPRTRLGRMTDTSMCLRLSLGGHTHPTYETEKTTCIRIERRLTFYCAVS